MTIEFIDITTSEPVGVWHNTEFCHGGNLPMTGDTIGLHRGDYLDEETEFTVGERVFDGVETDKVIIKVYEKNKHDYYELLQITKSECPF